MCGRGGGPRPLMSIAAMPFSRPPRGGGGPRRSRGSLPPGTAGKGLSKLPGGRTPADTPIRTGHAEETESANITYELGSWLIPVGDLQGIRACHYIPPEDVWDLEHLVQEAGASSVVVPMSHTAGPLEGQPGNCMLDPRILPHLHCPGSRILLLHNHRHTQHQAHTRVPRQATPVLGCHIAS